MDDISYKLDIFEGPLDLLLHLISKHKLNINDIPITLLVDQYLEYIGNISEQNMEIAGEFLEMAAQLIYIKTVSLLPQHEEAEKMRQELQGKLIEYSQCKQAAALMRDRYIGNIVAVRAPMKITFDPSYNLIHQSELLYRTYIGLNKPHDEPLKLEQFNTIVKKKIVSVTSKIIFVLKRLYTSGKCRTDELFKDICDRSERVAVFLAVLELTHSGRILLNEDNSEIVFNRISHRNNQEENAVTYET